jgi:hypothetical protein
VHLLTLWQMHWKCVGNLTNLECGLVFARTFVLHSIHIGVILYGMGVKQVSQYNAQFLGSTIIEDGRFGAVFVQAPPDHGLPRFTIHFGSRIIRFKLERFKIQKTQSYPSLTLPNQTSTDWDGLDPYRSGPDGKNVVYVVRSIIHKIHR